MIAQKKIPAWLAVLININIVVGSTFFLSASKLSLVGGYFAPFAWLICGGMLLPLVLVLAKLAAHYPTAGGLYVYSQKQLGTLWGFVSGWGYYIGAAAANALVLHAFSSEFQRIANIQMGLAFDFLLIVLFTLVNFLNIEFLEGAQIIFSVLKSIPLLVIALATPFLFSTSNITNAPVNYTGLFDMLPLVFFAYIGIEACSAIADKIEGGFKNVSRVIVISLLVIVSLYTLLQLFILSIHGTSGTDPFLGIIPLLTNNPVIITWFNTIISFAILSSFLGGFYGMFYFNNWNLHTIGKEKSIIFHETLTKLNKNQAPWVCVLVQSFLVGLFLLITVESNYLATMADFGTAIAYILSVISFWTLQKSLLGVFALMTCGLFVWLCAHNLISAGLYYAVPFAIIIFLGVLAHWAAKLAREQ